jgi:predicted nuclease of predicted toxin-antitoxin system
VQWKILLDEDISPEIAYALHDAGYIATSIRDRGALSRPDWYLLKLALEGDMVLCTKNADDFEALAAEWNEKGEVHCGILAVGEWTVNEMICAILDYLVDHDPNDVVNEFVELRRPKGF